MNTDNPRRLGKGLEALISSAARPTPQVLAATELPFNSQAQKIPIAAIRPNPFQPRRDFKPAELKELEDSLRQTGLLQPITVRPDLSGSGFELAAGERRLRAATNLGWKDIPATVRKLSDEDLLAIALVENLQRADLKPIEEAQGYSRLLAEFGLTQQSVAARVGKDRSTVANMLRLLQLPAGIRLLVQNATLTLGHARALLSLTSEAEQASLADDIVKHGLSVREVERRVRDRKPTPKVLSENRTSKPLTEGNVRVRSIEDQLRKRLQTDTRIALTGPEKGTIVISFYSADDLERLLDLLLSPGRERQ